jgi:tetratricopeptide (TPR) repeat protein
MRARIPLDPAGRTLKRLPLVLATRRKTFRLKDVRADGWFERLAESAPSFERLCEVVGPKFIAFSVIAGVRVTALTVDRRSPDASLVDFVVGEERLPLGEFQRRLSLALLGEEPIDATDLNGDSTEALQEFIGFRYVLLAPIFGLRLEELILTAEEGARIRVSSMDSEREISLEGFRELIRELIRTEVRSSRPTAPFSIDLAAIGEAEAAIEIADYDRAIELLGAWPGPLSLLLRTAEGQKLTPEVRASLARALGLLGTAYVHRERFEWAEEVMRLAIQWGQDSPAASELFTRMGEAYVRRERHGEAIGFLRRALALGAARRDVVPHLARAYAARGRWVAAVLSAEEAQALGVVDASVDETLERGREVLGAAWDRFRERVPIASLERATMPAPADSGLGDNDGIP